jgi:hypothetical protein
MGGAGSNASSGISSKRRTSPALTLPDEDDRHVLGAAIRAGTDVIVTFNLGDFPAETLKRYGIEGRHPHEFILRLLERNPAAVCRAARTAAE